MSVISAVESGFRRKLEDVVAMKGEHVLMVFSTYDTKPDFTQQFLNGTDVTLVSSGYVHPIQSLNTRINVTSIQRESSFVISWETDSVQPEDAGTFLATDKNARNDSEKNYAELIVTGKKDIIELQASVVDQLGLFVLQTR